MANTELGPMAKQTKKTKGATRRSKAKPGLVLNILPAPPPSQEDFKRVTVLDAMDSLADFERMKRS
jgi:hypothetical protein